MKFKFNLVFFAGLIFVIVGLYQIAFGISSYYYNINFLKNAISAKGVVTEINSYKRKKIFAPIYSYKDQNNVEHKSTSYFTSDFNKYKIGQELEILFDPQKPEYSVVKDSFTPRSAATMPCLLGAVFSILGIVIVKSSKHS